MPLSRFTTDKATVWTPTPGDPSDPFSDATWTRAVINVCYIQGGKTQRDSDGAEFMPQSTFYSDTELVRGQRIVLGEVADTEPTSEAETIRKPGTWTPHPRHVREFVGFTG